MVMITHFYIGLISSLVHYEICRTFFKYILLLYICNAYPLNEQNFVGRILKSLLV